MSTTSATEAARQRDGQFGPQVRTELDPANAGLGKPEAPPPTWDAARSHAEALLAQGVRVQISERLKWIAIRDDNGLLQNPDDGTPACQEFYSDGTPKLICHYTDGKRHDPDDGTPACQEFYSDGTPKAIILYTNGDIHDPDDGTPAYLEFYPDGTPERITHCTNGKFVSTESFPPPTGKS